MTGSRSAIRVPLLFLAWLLLTACGEVLDDRVIRMGLATAPLNLDPRFATDATSARINRLLYQRLVEFDARSMPVPGIADWRRISGTHYRFRVTRPRQVFSNGQPLTAADVVATYRFVLDPANASPHRSTLTLIEQVEQVNEEQIDFYLQRTDPLFPAYLALEILPAKLIAESHPFESHPVGSGGFRIVDRSVPGRLRLERLIDHQLIELVEVKNPTVRVLKLLRGEIHLLQNDLSPELVGYLKSRDGIQLKQMVGNNFSYIGFNMDDAATGNPLVRRAIAHAIDRQAIIRLVMNRAARTAEALFPPEHWAGAVDLPPIPYDPERAKALLGRAGYGPGNPLKLTYKTSSDPFRIRLATIIQSQLQAVGIELDLRSYDWGTFFGDIKAGRFQLYSLTWVGLRTPDSFRYIFASDHVPPAGANRGRYTSPLVDELLLQAESQESLAELAVSYRHIQQRLHEDLPYVPLWYEDQLAVSRQEVEGYRLRPDGNYDGLETVELMHSRISSAELADAAD